MNGGKRKGGRGGGNNSTGRNERSVPPKHSKTPDKEPSRDPVNESNEFSGVFNNPRFTHAMTNLIGTHLRVETKSKEEFEGVLNCFSPDFEIVLGIAHKIDPACPDIVDVKTIENQMVFKFSDVIRYSATDVDLDFGVKETFQTDTQISQARLNGGEPTMRELEMWMPEDDGGCAIEDDDLTSSNGWNANDMFAKNEERFGVKTSYDPQMSAYTTTLNKDRIDSEAADRAARIAASIEGDSRSRNNTELENGDEEEAFSAVVRPGDRRHGRERESPGDDKQASAYVPPGKRDTRDTRGGFSRGGRGAHGQRTPPPRSYENYDERNEHRQRGDDRRDRYSGGGEHRGGEHRGGEHRGGEHRGGEHRGGDRRGHRDDRNSYSERHHGDRGYHREDRGYGRQDSHGKKEDYRGGKEDYRGAKEDYRGAKEDYRGPANYDQQHRSGFQEQRGGGGGNRPNSSRDERKSAEKISPLPPLSAEDKAERRKSGEMNRSPHEADAGLPQRDARRKTDKSKEQSTAELQNFHQNFNLKIDNNPVPTQLSPSTPTVSINQEGGTTPAPSPGAPRDNKTPTPRPSPQPGTPTQGAPSGSPPDKGKPPASSSLNPNAKEFTLNVSAKEFTPRMPPRPSATPPRPQTPATPGQNMPMYANIIPVQGVPPQHMPIPFTNTNNQRPMRPNSKDGHMRPDLPSPMQVQQVTGQPILAQQLHQPNQYLPPAHMQYVQQSPGGPFVRMMVPGPPGMMPANLVHVPLSSQQGPGAGPQGGDQHFVPTSQYQNSPAPPHMWAQQVYTTTPSPMQPPQPGGQQAHPHTMAATPPAQGHTPAPSPGPQIIGYQQSHSQPNSLHQHQYPMIIMPSGNLPQFHQGPMAGGPPIPGGGQMMAGQPATSQYNVPAHFQYMQGGPIQMMAQHPHHSHNHNHNNQQ